MCKNASYTYKDKNTQFHILVIKICIIYSRLIWEKKKSPLVGILPLLNNILMCLLYFMSGPNQVLSNCLFSVSYCSVSQVEGNENTECEPKQLWFTSRNYGVNPSLQAEESLEHWVQRKFDGSIQRDGSSQILLRSFVRGGKYYR